MNISDAIKILETSAQDPGKGLPEEVFLFISKMTPLVNVDLLIKNDKGQTLLSWRNDSLHPPSWHVPGGIIRFKERIEQRVKKVALSEIGVDIEFERDPVAVEQMIIKRDVRGHFISFLFKGMLNDFVPKNENLTENDQGFLKWHDKCPHNLIDCHEVYRRYI